MDELIKQHFANQAKIISLLEVIAAGDAETSKEDKPAKGKTTKAKEDKPVKEDKPAKPTHTKDEVFAAVMSVRDALGIAKTKEIAAMYNYEKVKDAKPENYDAIVATCNEMLAAAGESEEEEDI